MAFHLSFFSVPALLTFPAHGELRLCAAGGGQSKDAICAAAPLCGMSIYANTANGKCGKPEVGTAAAVDEVLKSL